MIRKPYNYWNKEKCQEESLKYNNRKEFSDKSSYVYKICSKNKWLNDVCSHMIEICKPKNYWIKEKCQEESLKYKTRYEFQNHIKELAQVIG